MPPTGPDDTSTLERLRQRLYSPNAPAQEFAPPPLRPTQPHAPLPEGWTPDAPPPPPKKPRVSFAAIFLGGTALFFVLALSVAAYFLVFGGRSVSTERIAITIDGPTSIGSGDTVELLVSVENRNPVTITATSLSAEFPDTARTPENSEQPFKHYEDTLGDIPSGEIGTRSIRAVLYGGENERIVIPLTFEYRVAGSNATYVKEAEYEVLVTSSPLSVRAEAVSEVAVGQPLTFAVTVRSNAAEPLEHVAVLGQFPFGFTTSRGEGPLYSVGTLAPGEERTVTVTGVLTGEESEERVFRFTAGTKRSADATLLAVSYATAITPVTLSKPFLATTLSINRDSGTAPVIEPGTPVQGIVTWANTLAGPLLDGQVMVRLSGSALDTSSVSAYGGFYRSSDTTIIYSRETDSSLANLGPGEDGTGTFSFRARSADALRGMRNPTITATVSVSGRRVGESNVPETINAAITRTIKVGTTLGLETGATYASGAWPPTADQETTYSIRLAADNTLNTVADTVVTGTLPSYVRYVGTSDPAVSYSETSRTVTWRAGEIAPAASRTALFQVALLPSVSQRGTSPVLLSAPKAQGVDRFTQKQLSVTAPAITTQDAAAGTGAGIVR